METIKVKIIDGRKELNIGCSIEAYVNTELSILAKSKDVSHIKLSCPGVDYFVITYRVSIYDDDVPP